uniref:DDE Tnp4 domain-containing protein n=1 Tax=Brassica oleracea var. oleracea TaxID=109376 RepID=A0A0D3CWD1_BRAOL
MASSSENTFDESVDDRIEELCEQHFEEAFENLTFLSNQEERRKKRKKRAYIERHREEGHIRLWNDYFSETPTYPENIFRRRFRMNKRLFMHIVYRISNEVHYFREKTDALGRNSLTPLHKCTASIRVLAYGSAADTVDEYLRLGETTTRLCVEYFVEGTLNDINVLDRSPVFDDIINGQVLNVTFFVNGREYHMAYYLTDESEAVLFAKKQEAARKDVERAFGVLQARFAIVKNPALFWDKVKIGNIMRACIILHNMIVEDERDGYTQYDLAGFNEREDTET